MFIPLHSVDHGVCGSGRLEDEDHQEDLGIHSLVCLDPFVKLSIVDMLKCTTHTFYVWILVFRFWCNQYLFFMNS